MDDNRITPWPAAPLETWTVRYYGLLRSNGETQAKGFQVQARDRRQAIQLADREARIAFASHKFINAESGNEGGAA